MDEEMINNGDGSEHHEDEPMDDDRDSDYEDIDADPETQESGQGSTENGKKKKKLKKKRTYLPGMQMKDDETLECDESAYITLHTFTTAAPCLSFDVIPDNLGTDRKFPLTAYVVAGTQAQRSHANNVVVMKV